MLTMKQAQMLSMNLPRTGIEQPFMTTRPKFLEENKEFEPTHCMNVIEC